MSYGLKHAYLREGDPLPRNLSLSQIIHCQGRDEGTGLDIWWYGLLLDPDDDE